MRVTMRDTRLIWALRCARWLSTRQVGELCFPGVSLEMARRRLRLLRRAKYVRSCQTNSMAEAIHTLGPAGRDLLRTDDSPVFRLERTPPKNLEHFTGINDIRIAMERCAVKEGFDISFFFASWELLQQEWPHLIIPDAVCAIRRGDAEFTILFEYDRGEESVAYVLRTKFRPYASGLKGLAFKKVIIVVDEKSRLEQLRSAAAKSTKPDLFGFILLRDLGCVSKLVSMLSSTKIFQNHSDENEVAVNKGGRSSLRGAECSDTLYSMRKRS
jgi:hypothetical protein